MFLQSNLQCFPLIQQLNGLQCILETALGQKMDLEMNKFANGLFAAAAGILIPVMVLADYFHLTAPLSVSYWVDLFQLPNALGPVGAFLIYYLLASCLASLFQSIIDRFFKSRSE